jgi:4-hydroxybenzoyl-CoA thioesterase
VKLPYPDLVTRRGLGFPTVRVEMEYDAPVRYGDRVEVGIAIERIGRSSAHVRYEGRVEGRVVFHARNVAVCVDMKTFRPVPIPDDLRAAFESAKG